MRFILSILVPLAAAVYSGLMLGWGGVIMIGSMGLYCYWRGVIDEWRDHCRNSRR